MADVYTRIGYIKGATGAQGAQGAKGDTGDAATIQVGSVTTVPYGQTANVVNSGTEQAAIFDFTIPQGRPGQQTTEMDDLTLNAITTSSASFPIPAIGETGKVLWGKVVKWFSDMSALVATKLNVANVVNNLTTTSSGYALDARQGKALNDKMSWSEPSSVTGTANSITLPSTWQEASVRVGLGGSRYFMFQLTKGNFNFAASTAYNIRSGYYANSGNNAYVSINIITNTNGSAELNLSDATLTGSDLRSTTVVQAIWR